LRKFLGGENAIELINTSSSYWDSFLYCDLSIFRNNVFVVRSKTVSLMAKRQIMVIFLKLESPQPLTHER